MYLKGQPCIAERVIQETVGNGLNGRSDNVSEVVNAGAQVEFVSPAQLIHLMFRKLKCCTEEAEIVRRSKLKLGTFLRRG